jgi:hypothetical protein
MKKLIAPWIAPAFCAFLAAMPLIASSSGTDTGWWRPAFYAFLPMCFFFAGMATHGLQRDIRDLRAEVAELRQAKG